MRNRLPFLVLLFALFSTQVFGQASVFICLGPPGIGACTPVSATNPLPTVGTPSGTPENVNITQILGAAPSLTNPLWVFPATGATFPVSGTVTPSTGGATGSTVPANADYTGINVAGTLRGLSGLSTGSIFPGAVAIVDASGNQITNFGGTAPASSTTVTTPSVPTPGTFVAVLAANTSRKACTVTNIGTTQGYCNAILQANATTANTFPMAPGQQFFCASNSGPPASNAISCTCASGTCNFVVNEQ